MNLFGVELDWKSLLAIFGSIGATAGIVVAYILAYRRGYNASVLATAQKTLDVRKQADKDYDEIVKLDDDALLKRSSKWVRGGK